MKLVRDHRQANPEPTPENNGTAPASIGNVLRHPWKVLVVDDEPDVLLLTRMTLRDFEFAGRGIEILGAGSAAAARSVLAEHNDIAVAVIDVVMETDDAGLKLVEHIRNDLGNALLRLIIRTGQPGVAPERYVIDHYDIDDYKDKSELTATHLYTTLRTAIKSYRDLRTIDLNRLGLSKLLEAVPDIYRIRASSLNQFFEGVLTQIMGLCHLAEAGVTTLEGAIATIDGEDVTIRAVTRGIAETRRVHQISQRWREAVGQQPLQAPPDLPPEAHLVPLQIAGQAVGFIYVEPITRLLPTDRDLIAVVAKQCSSALENLRLHINLQDSYAHAIDMLAEVAEFKDQETGGHLNRIARYTQAVALAMGVTPDEASTYATASRLHDIGKVGIPESILCKPGKLTTEEFSVMKTHTVIGGRILGHDRSLAMGRAVALGHHERWSGGGYPLGIPASELPLVVRIVSVVDVFDALTSTRPYKAPWTVGDAAAELRRGAGSQFDPDVVATFLRLLDDGTIGGLREAA